MKTTTFGKVVFSKGRVFVVKGEQERSLVSSFTSSDRLMNACHVEMTSDEARAYAFELLAKADEVDSAPSITPILELARALNNVDDLPNVLARYEASGDHDHGRGSIKPGEPCPGGDCLVARAREIISKLLPEF